MQFVKKPVLLKDTDDVIDDTFRDKYISYKYHNKWTHNYIVLQKCISTVPFVRAGPWKYLCVIDHACFVYRV